MGTEGGQPDSDLKPGSLPERLRDRPIVVSPSFRPYACTQFRGQRACANRSGSFRAPALEPVRLATNPSLTFPAGEIQKLEPPDSSPKRREDSPPKMTVNFFGLTGHSGVLPTRYSELIAERLYARDTTLRDFLDIFNHRLTSLLYRAWEKYRFPVTYERGGDEPFTGYMLDLLGLGTPGLANRQAVPDQALICYEGLFAQFPRSAIAFRLMLAHYFEVPVEVVPFSGTWRPLDAGLQNLSLRHPVIQIGATRHRHRAGGRSVGPGVGGAHPSRPHGGWINTRNFFPTAAPTSR